MKNGNKKPDAAGGNESTVSASHLTILALPSEGRVGRRGGAEVGIYFFLRRFIFFFLLILLFSPIGCFSKTFLNPEIPLSRGAHIKGDSSFILYGVVIETIDGQSLDFANSAYVSTGIHLLKVSYYMGGAPNHTDFVKFFAEEGRKYSVKVKIKDQWTTSSTRYFFWVEDLKTGEIAGESAPLQ